MANTDKKINLAQLDEIGSSELGELQSGLEGNTDQLEGKDGKRKNKALWSETFSAKGKEMP